MCGILGVMHFENWGLTYSDSETFEQLLVAGALRGTDGTGAIIVKNDGERRSLKIGSDPFRFMATKEYVEFISPPKPSGYVYKPGLPQDTIIMGHNRFKTTGNSTTEHAHPHKVGNILLLHNGTLMPYTDLPRFKSFEVDSQALANAIDELGIDEAIERTHGAYALMYLNSKENSINILRNKERPLHYAHSPKDKRWIWASEKGMLEWIIQRSKYLSSTEYTVVSLETDELVTFYLDSEHPDIPVRREVKGPKTRSFSRGGGISWVETNEATIIDAFDFESHQRRHNAAATKYQKPPKKNEKSLGRAMKNLRQIGVSINIVKELSGLKKSDQIVFRVTDYADENPQEETFIIMGESPTLAKTSIRFRLRGAKTLDALFDRPNVSATIKNMLEYPEGNENGDKYVIWVGDPEVSFHNQEIIQVDSKGNAAKVDMYGRAILPNSTQTGLVSVSTNN